MRIGRITILLLLISFFGFSQNHEKILLEWKLAKNDTLKYKTTMNAVQIENDQTEQKDTASIQNKMQQVFKSLANTNSNLKYQTNLFSNKKNENFIDIEMKIVDEDKVNQTKSKNSKETKEQANKEVEKNEKEIDSLDLKSMFKGLASMNNNIVLRGRISKTGEIISDYYKNSQRNLIAILFELPNRKVEVGEKWKLNVHLIEMDQGFVCDSLSNENSVYIEKIIENQNERIAVIKYNISESVLGDFNNPLNGIIETEPNKKTFMKISHRATGNFSITKGKWISYDGEMEIENNVSMLGGKSKTVFKLSE